MFATLFFKEFRQLKRDRRFQLGSAVLMLLAICALSLGYFEHSAAADIYQEGSTTARQHWLEQGAKNPHSAAHYGMYQFKPPAPFQLLDHGVQPFTGVAVFAEAHVKNDATYEPVLDQSSLVRFGTLTPSFLLIYLLPLFLIFSGFALVSGEREQGVWRLLLSCHPPLFQVLLSKWLCLFLPAAVFAATCLFAGWLLALKLAAPAESWQQILALLAAYMLYLGTFCNLVLLLSSIFRKSHYAMVGLMVFWLIATFWVPRWAATYAEFLYPTPDRNAYRTEMKQLKADGMDGHNPKDDRTQQIRQNTLEKYGVEKEADLPINIDGLLMQEDEVYGNQIFDRYYARLHDIHQQQAWVYQLAGIASPALPMRQWSMGLTWTDLTEHWRFNESVESHRRDWVRMLNEDMMHQSRSGEWGYQADEALWQQVEPLAHEPASLTTQFESYWPYLASLALWFGATFIGLWQLGTRLGARL